MNQLATTHIRAKLEYQGKAIEYRIAFKDRKRLSITVHPDKRVTVVAPIGRDMSDIEAGMRRRARWVLKQMAWFDRFHPLPPDKRFVSGETHLYLGRQYRLKIHTAPASSVKLIGRFLNVSLPKRDDAEHVRDLVCRWYRKHARPIFEARTERCLGMARSLDLGCPELVVRKMRKRWGSCGKSRRILLNVELIKTPLHCIEYVIMHELCHLRVRNHGKAFQAAMARCMPDWEKRKRRLDDFVI